MSHLNKLVIFIAGLLLFLFFSITGRGQGLGFVYSSVVSHGGFSGGKAIWNVGGEGLSLMSSDPTIKRNLSELEGKPIKVTIVVVEDK